jgi:Protein of unknown function (DUF2934)
MAAGGRAADALCEEDAVMSAFPFGSSFGSEPRVLRGQRSRERKLAPARAFDPVRQHALIAEAAYYRAQRRGFAPGHELEDWLEAETQLARVC